TESERHQRQHRAAPKNCAKARSRPLNRGTLQRLQRGLASPQASTALLRLQSPELCRALPESTAPAFDVIACKNPGSSIPKPCPAPPAQRWRIARGVRLEETLHPTAREQTACDSTCALRRSSGTPVSKTWEAQANHCISAKPEW